MVKQLNRITYVEDEPDIRAVAELALTTIGGFTVDVCSSGADAIRKAPAFEPDLILLDVMMPEMDGTETFRNLKNMAGLKDTPIVFMTAKTQKHEVESFLELGAVSVISKPFDPLTLASEINKIWDNLNERG